MKPPSSTTSPPRSDCRRGSKMSGTALRRLAVLCLGVLALILAANPVRAEKVGVAAAVKPDAFSQGKEVKIGASVFYNQRINTSGSGVVQVLLVDGSTFTVGPGSDLVIDKFVYDPKKNKGEIVATFGKGVLRFVGGKISKNEGGVKVNMPSGALAIRGGMFFANQNLLAFIYGDELVYKDNATGTVRRAFYNGTGIDLTGPTPITRPVRPDEVAGFMKAFSGGGTVVVAGTDTHVAPPKNTYGQVSQQTQADETQSEGQENLIVADVASQETKPPSPPPPPP